VSPITHLVASWLVATVAVDNRRDRVLVTLAGVAPDLDGLGAVVDVVGSAISGKPDTFYYYQQYHHVLLHGWPGAVVTSLLLLIFARKKLPVFFWCLATYHLHLLCDLIGSRGPDPGDLWPICYSEPLFRHPIWFFKGQWRLDGWQNMLFSAGMLVISGWVAAKRGFSFLEIFSDKMDRAVVPVLRKWFWQPV
jgi:inner membrane protein